jgi:hypothetical protein
MIKQKYMREARWSKSVLQSIIKRKSIRGVVDHFKCGCSRDCIITYIKRNK